MSDIQALVQRLARAAVLAKPNEGGRLFLDAADALESQAKQIEELRREVAWLKDALSLVIVRHEEWAAQMPAGQFDDPLSDAVEKARPFARTGQIKELMKDARRVDWVLEATDSDRQTVDAAMQAEEGKT